MQTANYVMKKNNKYFHRFGIKSKKCLQTVTVWFSLAAIAVIAIPIAVLLFLVVSIWMLADFILRHLQRE